MRKNSIIEGAVQVVAGLPVVLVVLAFWGLRAMLRGIRKAAQWIEKAAGALESKAPAAEARAQRAAEVFSLQAIKATFRAAGLLADAITWARITTPAIWQAVATATTTATSTIRRATA